MQRTKERGITLIILAITVIVMLILAGVVINYALGEGGLIGRAEDASSRYQKAEANEIAYLNRVDQKYDDILNRVGGGNIEENPLPSPTNNPNPTTSPSPTTPPTGGTVEDSKGDKFEDTTTITDGNGEEVTIPGGFGVSPDSGNNVNEGIVVVDANGNEFVWVPVPDPTTMYVEEVATLSGGYATTNRYSKLRIISDSNVNEMAKPGEASSYDTREPDILSSTSDGDMNTTNTSKGVTQIKNVLGILGGTDTEILTNFGRALVEEYNAMIDSVIKYKGFYIARYELTGTVNNPTSKRGVVLTNQNWYALKKACNNIINSEYVQSCMVYGCQWDEVMDWIVRSGAKSNAEVNSNSSTWGNYTGSKKETGSNETWKVNNIYDLAGNCTEWTQEAHSADGRNNRGGAYGHTASRAPASCRADYSGGPTLTNGNLSTRPTLILK